MCQSLGFFRVLLPFDIIGSRVSHESHFVDLPCKNSTGNQVKTSRLLASVFAAFYSTFILMDHYHQPLYTNTLKVYMTEFFLFARLNLPNVLISVAKKILITIFLPRVLMCQKRQISLPVGYKTATPKAGDWKRL